MPQREFYKINFDGAVFRAGIGDIIWDCQGLVLTSMSQNILLPLTVVELEDLATVKALELAIYRSRFFFSYFRGRFRDTNEIFDG